MLALREPHDHLGRAAVVAMGTLAVAPSTLLPIDIIVALLRLLKVHYC